MDNAMGTQTAFDFLAVAVFFTLFLNKDKILAFEDKYLYKFRGFLAGLGYAFLIQLEKLFDKIAWAIAQVIIFYRRKCRKWLG